MKKVWLITGLVLLMISCYKADTTNGKLNEMQLRSPDNKIKLGNSVSELLDEINSTIGSNEASEIKKIQYYQTDKGYYSIVVFQRKDGTTSNMIFSSFLLNLTSNKFILYSRDSNNGSGEKMAACYKFWCTTSGNCTSCQVLVQDPFGSPIMRCSCEECHLHGQQVLCPQ